MANFYNWWTLLNLQNLSFCFYDPEEVRVQSIVPIQDVESLRDDIPIKASKIIFFDPQRQYVFN